MRKRRAEKKTIRKTLPQKKSGKEGWRKEDISQHRQATERIPKGRKGRPNKKFRRMNQGYSRGRRSTRLKARRSQKRRVQGNNQRE